MITAGINVSEHDDWYAERLAVLHEKRAQNHCSEADVSMNLVTPCIEKLLHYPPSHIDAEASMGGKRPDYVCRSSDGRAEVIVEVKNLDVHLTRRVSYQSAWHTSPYGQLSRYLEKYPIAHDGTWGIVTNGREWILLRRRGQDVEQLGSAQVENLADVERVLKPILESKQGPVPELFPPEPEPVNWLGLLQSSSLTPTKFIDETKPLDSEPTVDAQGHAFARVKQLPAHEGELWDRSVWLACLNIRLPDGYIAPPDITEELQSINLIKSSDRVYGITYWEDLDEATRCRGFLWERGSLLTTSALDAYFPGSRGAKQIQELAASGLQENTGDVLSGDELRREFYEEVDNWFKRTSGSRNDLRHMIRILFAWLLQERGVIPDTALWDPSEQPDPEGTEIHRHLDWLFTRVLAVEEHKRCITDIADPAKRWLASHVPFLNGSLFTPIPVGEEPTTLPNRFYVAVGDQPGLLTVLRRYDWTLHEQSGYESESALDPSMLGTLFERLMLSAEGPHVESGGKLKMPGGSYYTPQDVVDEMASDAIAHWLAGKVDGPEFTQLRLLAHPIPKNTPWNMWDQQRKDKLRELLSTVTVFDPCCGSGAFTVGILQALRRAHRRLADGSVRVNGPGSLEWIVEKQLHAADIHPIAVLITRLRLFIALVDTKWNTGDDQLSPLPNLETRCGTADTLCVELSNGGQSLRLESREWDKAIGDWQAARELWVQAHSQDDKTEALRVEGKARKTLKQLAEWRLGYDSAWLDTDFLAASERPTSIDVRKLFVVPHGWDIVIGNPPYQQSGSDERERGKRLGYIAQNNLYTMFIEAALDVCKEDGCVTVVVPHSIVFRRERSFRKLRQVIENAADRIDIRTYDNRPKPVFPDVPWIKSHQESVESRQRVTILSIRRGVSSNVSLFSRGVIRLDAEHRGVILRAGGKIVAQPKLNRQWTQAPSYETAELLRKMWMESKVQKTSSSKQSKTVAFPQTGMYFVTCLPAGLSPLRRPKLYELEDDEFYWPWVGLYNSHLFHAYWLMTGDAFHITATEYSTVNPPLGWSDESLRSETERKTRLLVSKSVLDACKSVHSGSGRSKWPNVNFHSRLEGQQVIADLDRLLIEAYDLKEQPLLEQIRRMRTGSAHNLPGCG